MLSVDCLLIPQTSGEPLWALDHVSYRLGCYGLLEEVGGLELEPWRLSNQQKLAHVSLGDGVPSCEPHGDWGRASIQATRCVMRRAGKSRNRKGLSSHASYKGVSS